MSTQKWADRTAPQGGATHEFAENNLPVLRGASKTLVIPLAARALMSRRDPENFVDPVGTEFLRMLGEEPSRFESDRWNMAGACARTIILDREVKTALKGHQRAVVVNLGAGLCSRYWRLRTPAGVRWIDVDLPEVIELKRQLLEACQLERGMAQEGWSSIPADVTGGAGISPSRTRTRSVSRASRMTRAAPA